MAAPYVVVVEDDPAIGMLIEDLLADAGYTTQVVPDGPTAVQCIQTQQPDLVILDLWLQQPGDGWLVLEQLWRDPHARNIGIIVCSGDTTLLQDRAAQLATQRCATLAKPFAVTDLLSLFEAQVEMSPRQEIPVATDGIPLIQVS